MNRDETRKAAEVMLAWSNGADVEVRVREPGSLWMPAATPTWSWDKREYRIKPVPREWWLATPNEGGKLEIWASPPAGFRYVYHVREVIE